MNNIEICKRIAEIEGIKVDIDNAMREASVLSKIAATGTLTSLQSFDDIYNPLTDDALNLTLRDKYCVEITYDGYCLIFDEEHFVVIVSVEWDNIKDINKSVCLAIIKLKEANNE